MKKVQLTEINLNLLVSLDALLTEKSVSRAAARVGVSQPAMSQSLRQLRETLDDPLLVRDRGVMVLTPAAEGLAIPLRRALVDLQHALSGDGGFDPATATRRFAIAAGDHVAVTLLPELLALLQTQAPAIDLEVRPVDARRVHELLATGEIDIALSANMEMASDLCQQVLYNSGFACLVRRGHPEIAGALTLEQYLRIPHVLISPGGQGPGTVDETLEAMGLTRRIALRVASFLAAPVVIAKCDLILTSPTWLAKAFAETHSLQILPVPIELPNFDVTQIWHQRFQHDPGHRWLRKTIADISRRLHGA